MAPPAPKPVSPTHGGLIHPISLRIVNLTANAVAVVTLANDKAGTRWSLGTDISVPTGFSVAVPSGNPGSVQLRQVMLSHKQFALMVAANAELLVIQLFAHTSAPRVTGTILLPTNVTMSIGSAYDSTNVFGHGSWSVQVAPGTDT